MTGPFASPQQRAHGRDRAVSFTVSYVLSLAVAVLLVSGVVIGTGNLVRDQRKSAIKSEATVVGDEVAASLMTADRLARTGDATDLSTTVDLPDRLADTPYTVTLDADGSPAVVVETDAPSVRVRVPLTTEISLASNTVTGGDVTVVYRPSSDELTLEDEP